MMTYRVRSKPKKGGKRGRTVNPSVESSPHLQGLSPTSYEHLSAFYSAGPVLSLRTPVQTKPLSGKTSRVTAGLNSKIQSFRGGGQPLPESSREFFESRFGTDFRQVRIHTGGQAARFAQMLNARAYTVGRDIVFGRNEYSPDTFAGRQLLSHELTHILQQRGKSEANNSRFKKTFSPHSRFQIRHRTDESIQRRIIERNYPGEGRLERVRPGEFLLWNFNINRHELRRGHRESISLIAPEIIAALNQDPNYAVDIEGQASRSGTDAVNNPLSARRAKAVREALVRAGVPAARIKSTTVGASKSLPDISQENMAKSRAVRIIQVPRAAASQPVTTTPPTSTPTVHPTCQAQRPVLSLTGGPVTLSRNSGQVVIQAGSRSASNSGMYSIGLAMLNPPGCGQLLFVQNVRPFREIVYKDGSRLRLYSSGWNLDNVDPYPSRPFPNPGPGITGRTANDSPAIQSNRLISLTFTECLINTMEVRDDFRVFLVLNPRGGKRQTLLAANWTFVGQARNTTTQLCDKKTHQGGGTLVLDTNVSRVIPSAGTGIPTSQDPVTSPNVTSVRYQIDRGGLTTTHTFADLFEPILNNRGKRRP